MTNFGLFSSLIRLVLNLCLGGLLSYHFFLSDVIFNVLLVQLIDLVDSQKQLCLHLYWVRNVVKIRANHLPLYNRVTFPPSQQHGLLWRVFAAGGEGCLLRYLFFFCGAEEILYTEVVCHNWLFNCFGFFLVHSWFVKTSLILLSPRSLCSKNSTVICPWFFPFLNMM